MFRDLNFNYFVHDHVATIISASIFNFLTIPFVETYKSIAFFNRFLFVVLVYLLYENKIISSLTKYFFLFSPSLILYSSLSLREVLGIVFYILTFYFILEKKFFLTLFFSIICFLIKANYFIVIIIFIFLTFNDLSKSKKYLKYLMFPLLLILIFKYDELISFLDLKRLGYFNENYGYYKNELAVDDYKTSLSLKNLNIIYVYLLGLIKIFFSPLNFNFSITNLILFSDTLIFLLLFKKNLLFIRERDKFIKLFIVFILISILAGIGILVFNYGSLHRYKLMLLFIFFVGLSLRKKKCK